jgi:hypothetical protein
LAHITVCFFFGWFEIFPYLSFGGYNEESFWHLVAVCRTTSLRPFFVDSADFFRKTDSVQCTIPCKGCENILILYDVYYCHNLWEQHGGTELCLWRNLHDKVNIQMIFQDNNVHTHVHFLCASMFFLLIGRKIIMWHNFGICVSF